MILEGSYEITDNNKIKITIPDLGGYIGMCSTHEYPEIESVNIIAEVVNHLQVNAWNEFDNLFKDIHVRVTENKLIQISIKDDKLGNELIDYFKDI